MAVVASALVKVTPPPGPGGSTLVGATDNAGRAASFEAQIRNHFWALWPGLLPGNGRPL